MDEAGINELRHQASGSLAILNLIFKLIDPALKIVDLCELLGLFGILLLFLFLFGFDLCFGSSPLRTYFQHLGADAFALCIKYEKLELNDEDILTRNGSGLLECSGNIRIHRDHEVLLNGDFSISRFDLGFYPINEDITEYCGTDITNPLFGRLVDLYLVWKVVEDALMQLEYLLVHILHGKSFVLRNADGPHFICFDV